MRGARHPPGMPKLAHSNFRLLVTLLLMLTTSSTSASAYTLGVTPPQTECFVTIEDAHLSTSVFEKSGLPAVKVNAKSQCNFPTSQLRLTVEIYKKGRFMRVYRVARQPKNVQRVIKATEQIENNGTFRICKNTIVTTYFGVVYARVLINGKYFQTPKARSEHDTYLPCGT